MATIIQNPQPTIDPLNETKFKLEMEASHTALLKVAAHQNPTFSISAGRFKLLFAALITEAEQLRDRRLFNETLGDGNPHVPNVNANEKILEGKASCELAIQHLEIACLLMVKATIL